MKKRRMERRQGNKTSLRMSALNESPMELCEENAVLVIEEVRNELGTIFGYDQGSVFSLLSS